MAWSGRGGSTAARLLAAGLFVAGVASSLRAATPTVQWSGSPDVARGLLEHAADHPELQDMQFEVPVAVVTDHVRQRLTNALPDEPAPPVNTVCSQWQAHLRIFTNTVALSVAMRGTVLRASAAQPASVRCFPTTVVFGNFRLNGRPAEPVRRAGVFTVPLTATGAFSITADLAVTPTASGAERTLCLPLAGFVMNSVRVDSDGAWEVLLPNKSGRLVGAAAEGTHGVITIVRAPSVAVTWRPPEPAAARAGVVSVRPSMAWLVGDRTLSAAGLLDVSILGGAADRLALVLPEQVGHVHASGPDVKYFRQAGADLDVVFRGNLAGRSSVRLSFDVPRGKGNLVTCPALGVRNGRLDRGGWLLVGHDGEGELLEQSIQGLNPRTALDLPPEMLGLLPGRPLFAYERTGYRDQCVLDHFATQPFALVDTIADLADVTALLRPDGEEIVRIRYALRNNRKQYLRLALPDAARLVWLSVEKKAVRPAQDGRQLSIPLVKSVQTMDGLVSFPVELIYCRRGAALSGHAQRTLDLPELADVPVAVVRAAVYVPPGVALERVAGALAKAKVIQTGAGLVYGQGTAASAAGTALPPVMRALAGNYYDAGYRAYRENRLEDAEEFLGNVAQVAPDAAQAQDARRLLDNIRAGRGEVEGRQREEKAKVLRVQKGLQADNPTLEARQETLVANAEQMIQTGNEEFGARFFEEAAAIGRKLVQRGAAKQEQQSVVGKFKDKLSELRRRETERADLNKRLAAAQQEAGRIALSATNAPGRPPLAQAFTRALDEAAVANQVSGADIQDAAFGTSAAAQSKAAEVDSRVLALQFQQQGAAQPVANAAPAAARGGRSLDYDNALFRRKVVALESALDKVLTAPPAAAFAQTAVSEQTILDARRQILKARENLDAVVREAEPAHVSARPVDEQALRQRLAQLRTLADAYANTYAPLDTQLDRDVRELRDRVVAGEKRVAGLLEARRKAGTTALDLAGVVRPGSQSDQDALVDFLDANYVPRTQGGEIQFAVANGQLLVLNNGTNAAVIGTAVDRLRRNSGLAVPVSGWALRLARVTDLPLIGPLFTGRTGNGRPYAVLDEAQYRTLLAAGGGGAGGPNQRQVVVGTPNRTAGEDFRLAHSGTDYNGIDLGGAEVRLPVNRYLAIDNGTQVTVLKAGAAAPWFQPAQRTDAASLRPVEPLPPELPLTGTAILLEKTLLAAGESPDVTLTYEYKERSRR